MTAHSWNGSSEKWGTETDKFSMGNIAKLQDILSLKNENAHQNTHILKIFGWTRLDETVSRGDEINFLCYSSGYGVIPSWKLLFDAYSRLNMFRGWK